jgi:hypothetical protein
MCCKMWFYNFVNCHFMDRHKIVTEELAQNTPVIQKRKVFNFRVLGCRLMLLLRGFAVVET